MPEYIKAYIALFIVVIMVAFDGVTIRLSGIDGLSSSFWRMLGGSTVMIAFSLYSLGWNKIVYYLKSMTLKQIASCGIFGISGIMFILAVERTTIINIMIIFVLSPLFGVVLSRIFLKERINNVVKLTSIFVAGGIIIAFRENFISGFDIGLLFAFGFMFANTSMSIVGRSLKSIPPTLLVGIGCSFWALVLLPTVPEIPSTSFAMGNMIFNAFILTPFCYWAIAYSAKRITAPEINIVLIGESFCAPIAGAIILNEIPTSQNIIGGMIVFTAVFINLAYAMYLNKKN